MSTEVKLSQGEKLIIHMLCEIHEHLKIKNGTDTAIIKEALSSGNIWGLQGLLRDSETPSEVAHETVVILAMWQRLEQSAQALSPADREVLTEKLKPLSPNIAFPGFDWNNELQYASAAIFLVRTLGRFEYFQDRCDLDSHSPTLHQHRRMLAVFKPILEEALADYLNVDQIAQVMAARVHPDSR